MRHQKAGLKLNRTSSHRKAMFRNMVTSLFKYEKIKTTDAKAKELRKWADHLVTLAKRGDLHARRQALSIIREKDVVYKLFDMAAERFGAVGGGYTRIVKIGRRPGDAAPMSIIELISAEEKPKKTKKKKTKKTAEKKAAPAKPKAEKEEAVETPADDKAEAAAEPEEASDSTEAVETAAAESEPEAAETAKPDETAEPEKSE